MPLAAFPLVSVAVQVTLVTPKAKAEGALFVIVTGNMSVAVAVPMATGVKTAVACAVTFDGTWIVGEVVSTTLIC